MEKKEYIIPDPNSPATFDQRKMLWAKTGKSWYPNELALDINKGDASNLIGNIVNYFKLVKANLSPRDLIQPIETKVRKHTGDTSWSINDLRNVPSKKGTKRSNYKSPVEPQEPTTEPFNPIDLSDFGNMKIADLVKINERLKVLEELEKQIKELETEKEIHKGLLEERSNEIKRLLAEIEELQKRGVIPNVNVSDPEFIKPSWFDKFVFVMKTIGQCKLVGPAGCGKTLAARVLAEMTERELLLVSCSGTPSVDLILGTMKLIENGNGTQVSNFVLAEPAKHLQKEKSLTVFDEYPAMEPDSTVALNGLMERRTRFCNIEGFKITRHEDNWIVCTGNTSGLQQDGKYIAAQLQDGASQDRLPTIKVGYEVEVENSILAKMEIKPSDASEMLERINHMRARCAALQFPFDPSTRRLVTCAELYRAGMDMNDAFEIAFLNDVSERDKKQICNWL